jgi:hypothetical protein
MSKLQKIAEWVLGIGVSLSVGAIVGVLVVGLMAGVTAAPFAAMDAYDDACSQDTHLVVEEGPSGEEYIYTETNNGPLPWYCLGDPATSSDETDASATKDGLYIYTSDNGTVEKWNATGEGRYQ